MPEIARFCASPGQYARAPSCEGGQSSASGRRGIRSFCLYLSGRADSIAKGACSCAIGNETATFEESALTDGYPR